jgi:hypothetical protein
MAEQSRWTILGETRKNGRKYYRCRCECGTEREIYYRSIESGASLSCGCLRRELTKERAMDMAGRQFGKLRVLQRDPAKDGWWVCECDCGNRKSIRGTSLRKQETRSCGCIQKEIARNTGTKTVAQNSEKQIATNVAYHTNFQVLENRNPAKNNTSGHKGVYWDKSRGKWSAYIQVHGKRVYLGRFSDYEDAVTARELAEEEYFEPLIEAKKEDQSNG